MVSRRAKLFGFRLHLTTTTQQIVDQWMLAPAAHHDGTLTPALLEDARKRCGSWATMRSIIRWQRSGLPSTARLPAWRYRAAQHARRGLHHSTSR